MKSNILAVVIIVLVLLGSSIVGIQPVSAHYDLSKIAYYDRVKSILKLDSSQEDMLSKYGFVVVTVPNMTRFENFYGDLVWMNDLPVIVTTDSILHIFHVVFDCSLRIVEIETFYPLLLDLTRYAFDTSLADYSAIQHDGSKKCLAIGNSTVYFAVALSLLTNSTVDVPTELSDEVLFYLDNIRAKDRQFVGAGAWTLLNKSYSIEYDFTQFTVRGHYLGEQRLEDYFQTMIWYGHFPVFIPRINETYEWSRPYIDFSSMVYMYDIIKKNQSCFNDWNLLYNVTNVLVGRSDSTNFLSLETALHKVFGSQEEYLDFIIQENGANALAEELSKSDYSQRILSQAIIAGGPDPLPAYPLIFQFMGQRYVPDSYIFQNLCWDKVGINSENERRMLPKGLDTFAVMGSERALQLLAPDSDYLGFTNNLNILQREFADLTEENWTYSSYTSWIHALQALVTVNYTDDYPEFMKSIAWQDEKLNTALGSWAQLRHDTILYAKQTYIPVYICSYPEAFLEPNPTFYSRMQTLVNRTLDALDCLPSETVSISVTTSLQALQDASQKYEVISKKELAKETLRQDEISFLKSLVQLFDNGCGGGYEGWYIQTLQEITSASEYPAVLDAPVIADVATVPPGDIEYPPEILHVATGNVDALVAVFPLSNGTLVTGVGPVFSYYEFPLIGTKRLNDEEWRQMLNWNNLTAYLPEALKDVHALAEPITPEYPSIILAVAFMTMTLIIIIVKKRTKTKVNTARAQKNNTFDAKVQIFCF